MAHLSKFHIRFFLHGPQDARPGIFSFACAESPAKKGRDRDVREDTAHNLPERARAHLHFTCEGALRIRRLLLEVRRCEPPLSRGSYGKTSNQLAALDNAAHRTTPPSRGASQQQREDPRARACPSMPGGHHRTKKHATCVVVWWCWASLSLPHKGRSRLPLPPPPLRRHRR